VERPFDLCELVTAAGGTFVSRWAVHRPLQTIRAIKAALQHKGFAFLEIITQCPTNFGRRALKSGDAVEGVRWIRSKSRHRRKELGDETGLVDGFNLGTFVQKTEPVFEGSSIKAAQETDNG
jgi:2-oxoglutarate ferredoxin oxidoreductase subunit beta